MIAVIFEVFPAEGKRQGHPDTAVASRPPPDSRTLQDYA